MPRRNLALILISFALVGCDRQSGFIHETSPFAEVRLPTPTDGKVAIAARGQRFAKQHGMKVHFVPDHFEPAEYTLSLTRSDLNIVAGNVRSGAVTIVSAYARKAPTSAQNAEFDAYVCEVMRHNC